MKITVESTDKLVSLDDGHGSMMCRVWEGETSSGVKVHCFIPRIAAKDDQDLSQFDKELQEKRPASAEIRAIPLRLIL